MEAAERIVHFFEWDLVHVNQVDRATKDILLTQRFTQHSSVLVTSIYLHPTDEDLARSVKSIRC